jgi:hypothetical protein
VEGVEGVEERNLLLHRTRIFLGVEEVLVEGLEVIVIIKCKSMEAVVGLLAIVEQMDIHHL